jgi:predicted AAA+ superfamily ATPase
VYGPVNHLFLDEIQDVPKWELFVNRLLRKGLHIVISGSNARLLSSDLATHLTGRFVSTELFPFSFAEYRAYLKRVEPTTTTEMAEVRRDYSHYAFHGGMPETFRMLDSRGYLRDIYDAILFRDILKRHNLRHPRTLGDVARLLMESYALEISYSNVAHRLGIKSVHTVQTYANYLESAYLIQTVNRFSFKTAERLKLGKVYAVDPGFISNATGVPIKALLAFADDCLKLTADYFGASTKATGAIHSILRTFGSLYHKIHGLIFVVLLSALVAGCYSIQTTIDEFPPDVDYVGPLSK